MGAAKSSFQVGIGTAAVFDIKGAGNFANNPANPERH